MVPIQLASFPYRSLLDYTKIYLSSVYNTTTSLVEERAPVAELQAVLAAIWIQLPISNAILNIELQVTAEHHRM